MTFPGAHLAALPLHRRRRLVDAIEAGMLPDAPSAAALWSVLGQRGEVDDVRDDLIALKGVGITGPAVAAWLRALELAQARAPVPDLVWSGPDVPGLHARDTRRVYEELLRSARDSVWMSTYVYFNGPRAFADLAERMDAVAGLRVVLMLNIQRTRGDTTASDHLVRRFADRFWGTDWPGHSKPAVYYDPRSLDTDRPSGVLHAKALVADEAAVFITSANLTEAALDRNIELGLVIRDPTLAKTTTTHFQALIDRDLLRPLPEA